MFLAVEIKSLHDYRRIQRLLLNCIVDKKTYFESYKEYRKSLCYFTKVDDTLNIANNCVTKLGEPNKAYDYLSRADSLYKLCNHKTYRIKNRLNIANVLNDKGERKKAIQTLLWITRQEDVKNDTAFMLQVYASLSSANNNIKLTEFYSRKAYRLAEIYEDEYLLMQASVNMGAAYINTNKGDSALLFYRKVWNYLQRNKNSRLYLPALNGMANSFRM